MQSVSYRKRNRIFGQKTIANPVCDPDSDSDETAVGAKILGLDFDWTLSDLEAMIDSIRKAVHESLELKRAFFQTNEQLIARVAHEVCSALEQNRKVILFGNGGSAADAQHIAAEWVGRFHRERRPLAAIALTTDTSILTAIGNDYGFDQVFVRQVKALGQKGDIAIAISTSGNSPNVLLAADAAREMGMVTVGLTGRDGGKLGSKVQYHLNVPHPLSARIQEVHIMVGHLLCELADDNMKGK